ncbi:MAG: peptidylprolyl isomerase [Oscillospiraceae bacterium]|nr:peptidylprolyl isomerase [Oscillospiraceae bacterium]
MKTKKIISTLILVALTLTIPVACSEKSDVGDNDNNNSGNNTGDNSANPESHESTPANDSGNIPESDPGDANYAIISVKDFGEITVKLYPEYAPNTVERFVENVRSGFYTGRNFHRVMSDFMIQGGSFDGRGAPDPTVQGVKTEVHPDARHYYGAFCLAANQLGEGGDSFYIVNNKNTQIIEQRLTGFSDQLDAIMANEEAYRELYGDGQIDAFIAELEERINRINEMPETVRTRYAEVGGTPELDDGYTVFGYTVDGFDVIDAISAVEAVDNGWGEISKPTQEIIIEWVIVKTELD